MNSSRSLALSLSLSLFPSLSSSLPPPPHHPVEYPFLVTPRANTLRPIIFCTVHFSAPAMFGLPLRASFLISQRLVCAH